MKNKKTSLLLALLIIPNICMAQINDDNLPTINKEISKDSQQIFFTPYNQWKNTFNSFITPNINKQELLKQIKLDELKLQKIINIVNSEKQQNKFKDISPIDSSYIVQVSDIINSMNKNGYELKEISEITVYCLYAIENDAPFFDLNKELLTDIKLHKDVFQLKKNIIKKGCVHLL